MHMKHPFMNLKKYVDCSTEKLITLKFTTLGLKAYYISILLLGYTVWSGESNL